MQHRRAWSGVIGPVAFVGSWVIAGVVTSMRYSPIDDAISRLAAVGSDVRWLMSVGFVTFGVGMAAYSIALRQALCGWAWSAALTSGVATIAVSLLPLDRSAAIDRLHGIAAAVGYVALSALPILAAPSLREADRHRAAVAGIVVGTFAALCLGVSLAADSNGLFQRIGLTVVDVWIVGSVSFVRHGGVVRAGRAGIG